VIAAPMTVCCTRRALINGRLAPAGARVKFRPRLQVGP
jgi:hypothetical protein